MRNIEQRFYDSMGNFKYKEKTAKNYHGIVKDLYEHTDNVYNEFKKLLTYRKYVFSKYSNRTGIPLDIVQEELMYSILLHDYGKCNEKWQNHCKVGNLINVGIRHEFIYLIKTLDMLRKLYKKYDESESYLTLIKEYQRIIIPIVTHHSKLSERHKDSLVKTESNLIADRNYVKFKKDVSNSHRISSINDSYFIDAFKRYEALLISDCDNIMSIYDKWYNIALGRYFVQLADKRASAKEVGSYVTDMSLNFDYKENNTWSLRNLQKKVTESIDDRIKLFRAPTGSGKTLACIIWANEMIKSGRADRLIIAMPTKFTSNALAKTVKSYGFDDVTAHHSNYKIDRYISNDYNVSDFIHSRNIESSVTICTIDHILNSLTLGNEGHHARLLNISNSCIVIDESDFYDSFVNANILKLLNFTYKFNVPVILMSATLPNAYVKFIEDGTLYEDISIIDDESDLERLRVDIKSIIDYNEVADELLKIVDKETAIIYCNTIKRSVEVYNILKEISTRTDIVLYHSRYKECDKNRIEDKIIKLLGEDAHRNGDAHGIVVMTQIGELSINISSDYILSELCPIDRMIQRFGRGCRFDKGICDVVVFEDNNQDSKPFPYVDQDGKEPNEAYRKTKLILNIGQLNGRDYLNLVNNVYDEFTLDKKSIDNSKKLDDEFKSNLILNPNYEEDNENSNNLQSRWRCRDIIPQGKLYIGEPPDKFDSYRELEFLTEMNSVHLPLIKINKFIKVILIKNVNIDRTSDSVEIKYISEEYYDGDGVGFMYPEEEKKTNNIL